MEEMEEQRTFNEYDTVISGYVYCATVAKSFELNWEFQNWKTTIFLVTHITIHASGKSL